MYDADIQNCIKGQINLKDFSIDPRAAADCIATKADTLSNDKQHFSPFAKQAVEAKKEHIMGGKPDDITVVVGQFKFR